MRRFLVWLCLTLCLACFCLPASAQPTVIDSVRIERSVDPAATEDGVIEFRADRQRWADSAGNLMDRIPGEHEGALVYALSTYLMPDDGYACVDLSEQPQDMSMHGLLRLVCRAEVVGRPVGERKLEVTLWSGEETVSYTALIPANDWCYVDLDLGAWPARDNLTRIVLRFTGEATLQFAYLRTDREMDAGLRERFLTDKFVARGGFAYLSRQEGIGYLVVNENSPMLTASTLVPPSETETNALRFVFDNTTACRSVTLQYAYRADGANARSVSQEIGEGRQIALFEVPDAGKIRYIRLIFTGAKEGMITLRALNAVSIYESGIAHLGTITECVLGESGDEITVRGTVAHDVMIANRENSLALFVLRPWETLADVLDAGSEPDAIADISIRFAFTLPYAEGDYSALSAGYQVAIQTGDAEHGYRYIPIADPHSLNVAYHPGEPTEVAKGVQTELVSTANQAGVGIYFIDLYLDRLCRGDNAGVRYNRGFTSLYFDEATLAALDEAVRLRSTAGERVYLRYLISDDATAVPFAIPTGMLDEGERRGILVASQTARDTVGAITDFLCRRYQGGEAGSLAGIILGTGVDDAAKNNNIGLRSLADYADCYADLITLVANTARLVDPAMRVIVPITDRRPAECITAELLESSYDSELFLRALFKRLDDLAGPSVSLMLESEHNPFSLVDGVLARFDEALEGDDDEEEPDEPLPDADDGYYSADELGDFAALIASISLNYASMPETFLYCWTPAENTGDALAAAYAYLYYRLRFSTDAEAFVVSFARAEQSGELSGMTRLKYLMKYIDTERSLAVSEPSLIAFDAERWSELILDFDADALATRTWIEGSLGSPTDTAIGTHTYWNFAESHSTRGWYAGAHVAGMAVRGSGEKRGLVVELDQSGAETGAYSEIVHRFDPGEPLARLDRLAFTLAIEGDGVWEVCITAGSTDDRLRLEEKQTLRAGETVTLCLDTTQLDQAFIDCLKLSVKPVSGSGEGSLVLYRVVGESDTLESAALSARLRELRALDERVDVVDQPTSRLAWLFATCAVVISTLTIAVLLGRHQDDELARQTKK